MAASVSEAGQNVKDLHSVRQYVIDDCDRTVSSSSKQCEASSDESSSY
jgi:hypothetical protein